MSDVSDETLRSFSLPARADPLLGAQVGSYRIESLIGSGAMGIVYRGVHTVIGKPVAIKVLKSDFSDDPEMADRLLREAQTVNAFRHPAIVDIFDFGKLPRTQQPYLVMDLLEGSPLDQYIAARAPMPFKQAFPMLDELLGALVAAHKVGVIHRDLKPGNVFVESRPEGGEAIKVIDFGLARQADRAGGSVRPTNPGTLLGTPAFMAPEQVLGQKVGPQTDLYAVGGIAYQMLTGHLPHEAPSAIETLSQKMQHDPVRPRQWQSSIEADLDAWVMKLLARDPAQRPADAEEARRALRRIADGRTTGARAALQGGAVPRRDWGDAKTILVEGASAREAEVSTDSHRSPWASPLATREAPAEPVVEPTIPPSRVGTGSSRRLELPTVAADPSERGAGPGATMAPIPDETLRLTRPPSVEEPVRTAEAALPEVGPSKTRLYVALGVAVAALVGGLAWLLAQR